MKDRPYSPLRASLNSTTAITGGVCFTHVPFGPDDLWSLAAARERVQEQMRAVAELMGLPAEFMSDGALA